MLAEVKVVGQKIPRWINPRSVKQLLPPDTDYEKQSSLYVTVEFLDGSTIRVEGAVSSIAAALNRAA